MNLLMNFALAKNISRLLMMHPVSNGSHLYSSTGGGGGVERSKVTMALPLPVPMLPGPRQNPEKITFVSMATFHLTLLPLNLENLALRIGYQPLQRSYNQL